MSIYTQRFIKIFSKNRLAASAAGLAYYITLTFFPLVIILYTMLGRSVEKADTILDFIESVMPIETVKYIRDFLMYVSDNYSIIMMLLAISVILISSSAAFRSIENTIGSLQGGMRFYGYLYFLESILLSFAFIIILYLSIIVLFFSDSIISALNKLLFFVEINKYYLQFKYLIFFGITFLIILFMFKLCKRKEDTYNVIIGAVISTLLLALVTYIFSIFINYSIKYPLVYGSLSAIILLMFWLYCCCLMVYIGADLNITIYQIKNNIEIK